MSYQIKLNNIHFTKVELNINSFEKTVSPELETSFKVGRALSEDRKSFAISFDIRLKDSQNLFNLNVESVAHFQTDKEYDDQFKDSQFCKISAPAIAFPYLRTFISNITLNAGYDPIILPSFNFVKMAEESNDSSGS